MKVMVNPKQSAVLLRRAWDLVIEAQDMADPAKGSNSDIHFRMTEKHINSLLETLRRLEARES